MSESLRQRTLAPREPGPAPGTAGAGTSEVPAPAPRPRRRGRGDWGKRAEIAVLAGPAIVMFLAFVIVVVVSPVGDRLRRAGAPGWLATVVLVLMVYAVVLVLTGTLLVSAARLATGSPGEATRARRCSAAFSR